MERSGGKVLQKYSGRLEVREAAYAFEGAKGPLFEKLTFSLSPGSILAVKGYNGSGKTTLLRMLAGLLEPTSGEIFADGEPLGELAPNWWRGRLIYMPQEPNFIAATVRENILSGNPDLESEEMNRIIRASGLRHFIDTSPKGLETMLPGGGTTLPLGTKKRLALARALATDGELLLMDEPTEGLDAEGKAAVYSVMNGLAKQGRTIVVVTYDANILKGASRILDLGAKPYPELTQAKDSGEADESKGEGS
jgi:ATP-binding cassette subfamily C protein LapB